MLALAAVPPTTGWEHTLRLPRDHYLRLDSNELFALAGAGEISIVASLLAVLAFAIGATIGGRWAPGRVVHRGYLQALATSLRPASFWSRPS
jgi:hypothetical protein